MTEEITNKQKTNEQTGTQTPTFTESEIENIVKAFILALIHNRVQINFPNIEDILDEDKLRGKTADKQQAWKVLLKQHQDFEDDIQVFCRTEEATDEERKEAISELFGIILLARTSGRMIGSFEDYELKKRMDELEEKLGATNKIIQEFVNWYTETENGYDKLP